MSRKPSKEYNFKIFHPEIAKEWHTSLNGDNRPDKFTPGSGHKAWWKCEKCSSAFLQSLDTRRQGSGCPYCSGRKVNETNSLKATHPSLVQEWDHSKNENLSPERVSRGSENKIWWKCQVCNHSWKARIANRTKSIRARGCPKCSGKFVDETNSLASNYPELLKEWNYEKNNLNPDNISIGSNKKVWWLCKNNHEWQTSVHHRTTRGTKCALCRGMVSEAQIRLYCELKTILLDLEFRQFIDKIECDILERKRKLVIEYDGSYWHDGKETRDKEKNKSLELIGFKVIRLREPPLEKIGIDDLILSSESPLKKKDIDRFLKKLNLLGYVQDNKLENYLNENEFFDDESFRKYVKQLPTPLYENSFEYEFPDIAKEYDHKKNFPLQPKDFLSQSNKIVWWKCPKGSDHQWRTSIGKRTVGGRRCPFCIGKRPSIQNNLFVKHPELVKKEWDFNKNNISPKSVLPGSQKKYWWKCKYGHSWEASLSNRTKKEGRGCPFCANKKANMDNSLGKLFPKLLEEWNYEKNKLTPYEVVPGSAKKVWWKCSKGHEWESVVSSRIKQKYGCKICSRDRKYYNSKEITVNDINFKSISAAAKHFKIDSRKVRRRLAKEWSIENAFELNSH